MTIKEITALRKNGQLQEALEGAEQLFNENQNEVTAGALFWTLNEICKNKWGDEGNAIYQRMLMLYDTYCQGKEFMLKSLHHTERHLIPYASPLRDATEAAKGGADALAPYAEYTALYDKGEIDPRIYHDYGWLTAYAMKQADAKAINERKQMLHRYMQLDLPRPSALHSKILTEAVKLENDADGDFAFDKFAEMWGLDNLTDRDWEQYRTPDGKTLPSLVEKVIGAYIRTMRDRGTQASATFARLVDKAEKRYANNPNMPYYKALLLLSQGRRDEALEQYRNLLQRYPSKSYLWSQASDLTEDTDQRIGLLAHGITCGDRPEFIGKLRLKLARIFIDKQMWGNALTELNIYRDVYQRNGWHLNNEYTRLAGSIPADTTAVDNRELYNRYIGCADTFIYGDIPTTIAVKVNSKTMDDRVRPGHKLDMWTLRSGSDTYYLYKPTKYGLDKYTPNGMVLELNILNGRISRASIADSVPPLDWLRISDGEVRMRTDRNGRPYTIIDNTYVPDKLLANVNDGQQVRIVSMEQSPERWVAVGLFVL